jgi:hypothetical protein
VKTYRNDTGATQTVMTEPPQLVEPGGQISVPDGVHIAGLDLTADENEVDDDGGPVDEAAPVPVGYGTGQLGDSDAVAVPADVTEVFDPAGEPVEPPSTAPVVPVVSTVASTEPTHLGEDDRFTAPDNGMDGFSGDEDNADPEGRLTDPVDAPAPAANEQDQEATP